MVVSITIISMLAGSLSVGAAEQAVLSDVQETAASGNTEQEEMPLEDASDTDIPDAVTPESDTLYVPDAGQTAVVTEEPAPVAEEVLDPMAKENCTPVEGLEAPTAVKARNATIAGQWKQEGNGRWWYPHNDGTYTRNGWEWINDAWYRFDGDGWMMTGWINNGAWYYCGPDGRMWTGWLELNGRHYYMAANGVMQVGWIKVNGKDYYMMSDGMMRNTSFSVPVQGVGEPQQNTRTYNFKSTGELYYTTTVQPWKLESGGNLVWKNITSSYRSYIISAQNKWNAYKPNVIREIFLYNEDVRIYDYYKENDVSGTTSPQEKIEFNTYQMEQHSDEGKLNVVLHEFGHALGLGHGSDDYQNEIMFRAVNDSTSLSLNDKRSYDAAYK